MPVGSGSQKFKKKSVLTSNILVLARVVTYISGPELHPPSDRRIERRRFEAHGLPVAGLDILINKTRKVRSNSMSFNRVIFIYYICLISISASLSDWAIKISILNIQSTMVPINFLYKFDPDVFKTFSVTQVWKLDILQRMYGLINSFVTQKFCSFLTLN